MFLAGKRILFYQRNNNFPIHESELQNLVVRAINMALGKKDTMNETLQRNVEAVLTGTDGVPIAEIDARLEELQKELLKVANAKGNYDSIVDEIYSLREAKQNAQVDNAEREGMKQRISEMQQFLTEQTQNITEYDEQLVRRRSIPYNVLSANGLP